MNKELNLQQKKELIDGFFNKGWACDLNEVYSAVINTIDELQKKAELGEHYKRLYSKVKKQKDDVVVFAKKEKENYLTKACRIADTNNAGLITSAAIYTCDEILRMLGEIDE